MVHISGLRLAQVAGQADPHVSKTSFLPQPEAIKNRACAFIYVLTREGLVLATKASRSFQSVTKMTERKSV